MKTRRLLPRLAACAAGLALGLSSLPALAQPPAPTASLVRNGGMEAGTATPNFWRIWHKNDAGFAPVLARDTAQKFSGDASLRVHHPTAGYSSVQSDLARTAPRIKARAAIRVAAEEIEALDIGIQCFDENRRQIRWLSLAGTTELELPWRVYEEEFQLPAGTVTWQFVVGFRGRGTVWVDEVSVTAVE